MPVKILKNKIYVRDPETKEYIDADVVADEAAHVYIKYAATQPTSDSDMKDEPDAWMGIHTGIESSAPTSYTDYVWNRIRGEQGQQGIQGEKGDTGATGPQGQQGVQGIQGLQGERGLQGPKGDTGDPAPASAVIPAVEDWLDEHPEATTTVQDGSIGRVKLTSALAGELDDKAPGIIDETTGYSHGRTDSVRFIGNTFAWGNARYANAKNLIDGDTTAPSGTFRDVAYVKSKNGIVLNGTCSAGDDAGFRAGSADIPAGTYTFKIEVHPGDSVLPDTKGFYIDFWYDGNETTTHSLRGSLYVKYTDQSTTITLTNHVYKIRIWWGVKKDAVYDDYRLFYSLLPSSAVITDTQQTVASTGTLDFALPSAMSVVDTLMHESTATELIDTKQYVDNHTPDLVYLRPEDFGAKGDGSADDSTAIAACLAASKINDEKYLPVRGFGIYSVANPIVITGRHANVFFHQINYTGSDVAVKVSGSNNKIEFDYIYAINSNTAKGIQIDATGSTGFNSSELSCNRVRAASHAVYFASVLPNVISYNVFRFNLMSSGNGDIFHFAVVNQCNENVFYGEFVAASNGYFAISENSYVPQMKLHNFCLESDLKYGIKGVGARLHDCRTAEFMGQDDTNDVEVGKLFNFSGRQARICMSDEFTEVNLQTVYIDDSMTYAEVLEEVEANFSELPPDATSEQKHYVLEPLCFRPCTFKYLNCLRRNDMQVVPYGEIIAYHNKKVIKLHDELKYNPTGSTFNTASEETFPTFFDLADSSASVVSIYLNDNYCWPGINKFKVKQYASIKAKVYDKNNTLIFDGTSKSAGIYEFECSFVRLDSLVLNLTGGRTYSVPLIYRKNVYTGENEHWTVIRTDVDIATTTETQAIISSYWG